MKTLIISILLLFAQQASANTFFDQLCEFNPNWKKYKEHITSEKAIQINSEVEYVQVHLTNVLSLLRSNPTDRLTSAQIEMRSHLIQVLDDYRLAGKFPINYYRMERIPVFIDEHNTHCAVGHLMQQTGYDFLAKEISAMDNYVWVKDLKDARVIEWQKASGFTLEELKIIQGAYDFYMENAFILPNRHEIPQKPACATAYFEDESTGEELAHVDTNLWFHGEGKNGVLNGKWVQNYAVGIPWILGYFKNGKRTGQWKEYYQGTDILCRTENWRDDKLNGMRIRFDRNGEIIEEILFKDGNAITKTNYDRADGTKSIRKPLDSLNLSTEVYTLAGRLLASGNEQVHNPGNLLWFQNIELTALNSAAITARDMPISNTLQSNGGMNGFFGHPLRPTLFQTPPLVNYKKVGKWIYYGDSDNSLSKDYRSLTFGAHIESNFEHLGVTLSEIIADLKVSSLKNPFDSVVVYFENDAAHDFIAFGENQYKHIHLSYHDSNPATPEIDHFPRIAHYYYQSNGELHARLKEIGEYDKNGWRIGEWKHFDLRRQLVKLENYLIPHKEEELVFGQN